MYWFYHDIKMDNSIVAISKPILDLEIRFAKVFFINTKNYEEHLLS